MAAVAGRVVNSLLRLGMSPSAPVAGMASDSSEEPANQSIDQINATAKTVTCSEEAANGGGVLALPWHWYSSLKWCPTSEAELIDAERRIMSKVKAPFTGRRVDFTSPFDHEEHHVWTLCFEAATKASLGPGTGEGDGNFKKPLPLVLVHGFGNGAAFWCGNFDYLAEKRDVYAVDLPGFARSYRPKFCTDPKKTEDYYTHCIEEWRRQMGLDKMILLGHSMGGFVVSRYVTAYPDRVAHLILVDPWGLTSPPHGIDWTKPIPFWIRSTYMTRINPLRVVRAMGPLGPIVSKIGAYYAWNRYSWFLKEEASAMADYLFHGNVLAKSGEDAFEALTHDLFWAKHPALDDLTAVDPRLGISFLYGAQSWLDPSPAAVCRERRPGSFVGLDLVDNSGHDIFADAPHDFNRIVAEICGKADGE